MAQHGRFVWYELMTTDMAAAKAFYTKVVGWGTEDASMPGMAYTLFTVKGVSVGGLLDLPKAAMQVGERPGWIGYVEVDDVDGAAVRVKELGGTVYVPPRDIPNVSRFAVVADPQTAMLALVKGREPGRRQAASLRAPGRVGWHELFAADTATAFAFYREVFGWQKGIAETGAKGTYQLFAAVGETVGAMLTKPAETPVPFWLYYFNVADIDAAMSRVKAGGGEILRGPEEVPDGSWIVHCTDPQQTMFALIGRRSYRAVGFLERVMPPSAN